MKKLTKYFCFLIVSCFFLFTENIRAIEYDYLIVNKDNTSYLLSKTAFAADNIMIATKETNKNDITNNSIGCEALLGDPEDNQSPAYWLQFCLNIMKYIGIIALLALSSFDFFKAMTNNDKDAMKKATTTTAKRFIFVVLLFFLPIIVEVLMKMFGAYGTCGLG